MLIKANPTHTVEDNFNSWSYDYTFEKYSITGATITDRYPTKGFALNESVELIFFVFDGQVCITLEDGEESKLVRGDIFVIPKKTPYFMVPHLCLQYSVWMLSTPHFDKSQHKFITKTQKQPEQLD